MLEECQLCVWHWAKHFKSTISFIHHNLEIKYYYSYTKEETTVSSFRKRICTQISALYTSFIGSPGLGFKHEVSVAWLSSTWDFFWEIETSSLPWECSETLHFLPSPLPGYHWLTKMVRRSGGLQAIMPHHPETSPEVPNGDTYWNLVKPEATQWDYSPDLLTHVKQLPQAEPKKRVECKSFLWDMIPENTVRQWGSDTRKGGKPVKIVILSGLLQWRTGAQFFWATSERQWKTSQNLSPGAISSGRRLAGWKLPQEGPSVNEG